MFLFHKLESSLHFSHCKSRKHPGIRLHRLASSTVEVADWRTLRELFARTPRQNSSPELFGVLSTHKETRWNHSNIWNRLKLFNCLERSKNLSNVSLIRFNCLNGGLERIECRAINEPTSTNQIKGMLQSLRAFQRLKVRSAISRRN